MTISNISVDFNRGSASSVVVSTTEGSALPADGGQIGASRRKLERPPARPRKREETKEKESGFNRDLHRIRFDWDHC